MHRLRARSLPLPVGFATEVLPGLLAQMSSASELLAGIEAQRDRQRFMLLPIETRMRNTCPGCGCRLMEDFSKALEFVAGPIRAGQCRKCGWVGEK